MAIGSSSCVFRRLAEDQAFHVAPDLNVLAYTIAIATLSCLAFGLAPALHGTRGGISAALKAGSGSEGAQRVRLPMRSVLLSVQVAISVILLANAGLLVRGMQRAQALDPGFDVQNSTVLSIDLPASQYTGPRTMELTRDLLAQLDHSGDAPAYGLALNPPLSNTTTVPRSNLRTSRDLRCCTSSRMKSRVAMSLRWECAYWQGATLFPRTPRET